MGREIGFIGTGLMGRGMARNLIRKGHKVKLYNRTRAKAEEVAQLGGTVVDTPAEAARDAEVVVTMLADHPAVVGVLEGPQGILSTIKAGAVVIDSSTVSPITTKYAAGQLATRKAHLVDAPVFGSKGDAEKAELGFIVGADRAVFDSVQDVFQCMGKTFYVGGSGMGANAKLVVNHIIAVTLQAMNEGLLLATKAGVDPDIMLSVIQSSRARSGIIEMKAPPILKGDFTAFFPLRLMDKDMGLVMDTAHALKVPMPTAALVKEIYSSCMANGQAEEDFSATIRLFEKITQVEVRSQGKS